MTVLAATGHSEAAVTRVDATVDEVAFQVLRENPVAHMRPVVLENDFGKDNVFREFRFGGRVENYNGGGGEGKETSNGCDETGRLVGRDGAAARNPPGR